MSNRYFFMYQAAHSVASLPCLNENKQRTETQVNVLILKIIVGVLYFVSYMLLAPMELYRCVQLSICVSMSDAGT